MRIVAVVQARIQSTRLPAKILLDLGGMTALERCLSRVKRIRHVNEVVLATSEGAPDDILERVGERLGVPVVRGSELDVLSRFLTAARQYEADAIVRITSDCPFLDPEESSRVVEAFLASKPDYAANVLDRTLPRGLDTEIISRAALEKAGTRATKEEREHVTLHVVRRPAEFVHTSVTAASGGNASSHRWTLDTIEDYQFLHALASLLGPAAGTASCEEIVRTLERHPHLLSLNSGVEQKRT